jgi:replicative DNA helicase
VSGLYHNVDALFNFAKSDVKRVGTGIKELDKHIRGVAPGEVCTILGTSGSGKSLLGQVIIHNNKHIPSMFFSMEMPAMQATIRLYSMWSNTPAPDVQDAVDKGDPPLDMWDMVQEFSKHRIDDRSGLSTAAMSESIAEYESDYGFRPEFVVLDYLELIGGTAAHAEGVQGVDAQATMIKEWAKQEEIRVFLLHQTNRSQKEWHAPTKDSARYGGYTQADFVIGLWQRKKDPELEFLERLRLKNTLCVNIIKNRPFFELADYIELTILPSLRIWQEGTHDRTTSKRWDEDGAERSAERERDIPDPFSV